MIGQESDPRPLCTPIPHDLAGWMEVAQIRLDTLKLRDLEIQQMAGHTLNLSGELSAVKAACNFDPAKDRDVETAVRNQYHALQDARAEINRLRLLAGLEAIA